MRCLLPHALCAGMPHVSLFCWALSMISTRKRSLSHGGSHPTGEEGCRRSSLGLLRGFVIHQSLHPRVGWAGLVVTSVDSSIEEFNTESAIRRLGLIGGGHQGVAWKGAFFSLVSHSSPFLGCGGLSSCPLSCPSTISVP